MFEWKVEDMVLMKQKEEVEVKRRGKFYVYACEKDVSREDKIAFVDSYTEGRLSYILSMIDKFNAEREKMPKDERGEVKTVSLKAWLKRNDTKYGVPIFNRDYHYGFFHLFNGQTHLCSRFINMPTAINIGEYHEDVVDEAFRKQLIECENEEYKYFLAHDEYSILKQQFKNNRSKYATTFGVMIGVYENGRIVVLSKTDERDITIEELKILLEKYKELEDFIDNISKEIDIKF